MKICIVSEIFAPIHGGQPVAVENLADALTVAGHEVAVVTTSVSKKRVHQFDDSAKPYVIVRIQSVDLPVDKEFRMSVLPRAAVARFLNDFQPDCIHIHTPWGPLTNAALREARKRSIPVVATNHIMEENGTATLKKAGPLAGPIARGIMASNIRNLNRCSYVTAPTNTALDLLGRHKLTVGHSAVSNGLDADFYHPVKTKKPAAPFFFSVGRLSDEKHVDITIRAFAVIHEQHPEYRLLIAGRGPETNRLHKLAKHLKVDGAIEFLGFISEDDKRRYFSSCVAYLNACPAELQCITALEALACNRPVVLADKGATIELVKPGKNGYLFRYPDVDDMARAIDKLIEHPITSPTIDGVARDMVQKKHALPATAKQYAAIYRQVIRDNSDIMN